MLLISSEGLLSFFQQPDDLNNQIKESERKMEVEEEVEIKEEEMSVQRQFRSLLVQEKDIADERGETQVLEVSGSGKLKVFVNPSNRNIQIVGHDSSEKPPNNWIEGQEEVLDFFTDVKVLKVEKIGG